MNYTRIMETIDLIESLDISNISVCTDINRVYKGDNKPIERLCSLISSKLLESNFNVSDVQKMRYIDIEIVKSEIGDICELSYDEYPNTYKILYYIIYLKGSKEFFKLIKQL